ncbi:MAG: SDR family oxidoreductase [Bacteroidales bacterium]
MFSFDRKVVIITGASSGIGLASVRLFAQNKAYVVLAARSEDIIRKEAEELSKITKTLAVVADVSKEEDCRNLINKTVEKFGQIDVLVNNAGISMRARFEDLDLSVLHKSMDVNFWGTVYCTKFALPYLLKSKGSVVGVTSVAGFKGLPGRTGYSSSKFAIIGFLDCLRGETINQGLHVMVFAPGYTASNVRFNALLADGTPQGSTPRDESKMMTADRVAEKLLKGVKHRTRQMILTSEGRIAVLLNRIFPRWLDYIVVKFINKEK